MTDEFVPDGIIAVLRASERADYLPVVQALVAGGISAIELTLTSPSAIDEVRLLRTILPAEVAIGLGSLVSATQAKDAIDAGASFLVTPAFSAQVIEQGTAFRIPVISGAMTPTEVLNADRLGAAAVKIFPANVLTPKFLRQLRAPFPELRAVPSGGIRLHDVAAWMDAGAVAVCIGSELIGDALTGGDMEALRLRAEGVARTWRHQ